MWRGDGKIKKWQVNGKIYQPLGNGGDFVSIAGHYNQNRNNNYNNPNLTDLGLCSVRFCPHQPGPVPGRGWRLQQRPMASDRPD